MRMGEKYFIVILFISSLCSAQVGIGTITPEKELHIAGINSTIRIEMIDDFNSPTNNDGIKPALAFVNAEGDIKLGTGTGLSGGPFNFLIDKHNFIPDNPYGWNTAGEVNTTGVVINSEVGQATNTDIIIFISFTVPHDALIEVKYGITLYVKGEDMSANPPDMSADPPRYVDIEYGQAINMITFFCIDLDNDGFIDASEFSKKYGLKGQYFETQVGGISGFPYMNGQGYLTIEAGTYNICFFGMVNDHDDNYTSVGFGGKPDYLKIRVYN